MNAKALIGTVIETIVKVLVIAAAIILTFQGATKAYEFGYRVFADEPVSAAGGRTITVGIAEDADIKDIAKMLEEKGLISDYRLFIVQELLSAKHGKLQSGIYDLSTDMTAAEMLEILSGSGEGAVKETETVPETQEASPETSGTEAEDTGTDEVPEVTDVPETDDAGTGE